MIATDTCGCRDVRSTDTHWDGPQDSGQAASRGVRGTQMFSSPCFLLREAEGRGAWGQGPSPQGGCRRPGQAVPRGPCRTETCSQLPFPRREPRGGGWGSGLLCGQELTACARGPHSAACQPGALPLAFSDPRLGPVWVCAAVAKLFNLHRTLRPPRKASMMEGAQGNMGVQGQADKGSIPWSGAEV